MVKFFRKIRQKLIDEGNLKRYLIYAIGEILLVMVGILLALQINNANELKKTRAEEKKYLVDLKSEITTNISILESEIAMTDKRIKAAQQLANWIAKRDTSINELKIANLTRISFIGVPYYTPNNVVVNVIESTGSLKIIQNDTIKKFITSWHQYLTELKQHEGEVALYRQKITDIFINEGNVKMNFDITGLSKNLNIQKGHSNKGNLSLLRPGKYENNLILFIATITFLKRMRYIPLLQELKTTLQIIEQELNQRM